MPHHSPAIILPGRAGTDHVFELRPLLRWLQEATHPMTRALVSATVEGRRNEKRKKGKDSFIIDMIQRTDTHHYSSTSQRHVLGDGMQKRLVLLRRRGGG